MKAIKFSFVLTLVLLLAATQACKKTDKTCQLSRLTVSDGISTVRPHQFFYAEDGDVRKIIYPNDTYDSIVVSADTMRVWKRNFLDTLIGYTEALVNSNGYITTGYRNAFSNTGVQQGSETFNYEYNADGTLMRITLNTGGSTSILYFTYLNGLKTEGILYENGAITERYAFEYEGNKENKTGVDELLYITGDYFPFDGKAAPSCITTMFTYIGNDTVKILFVTDFDEYGYTSKVSRTDSNAVGFDRSFYTFAYTCEDN